jgi:hypothetical protein
MNQRIDTKDIVNISEYDLGKLYKKYFVFTPVVGFDDTLEECINKI